MKRTNKALIFAVLAGSIFSANTFASSTLPTSVTTTSSQTTVLAPDSTEYKAWAAWIKQQQDSGVLPNAFKGVGQISIQNYTQKSIAMDGTPPPPAPVPPAPGGPITNPGTPLPPSGVPGQKYSVTNSGPSGTQTWTYTWDSAGDGWSLTSYTTCAPSDCGSTIKKPE